MTYKDILAAARRRKKFLDENPCKGPAGHVDIIWDNYWDDIEKDQKFYKRCRACGVKWYLKKED